MILFIHDTGAFGPVTPEVHEWFEHQKSRDGMPCCSLADGYPTTWRSHGDNYQVIIDGKWYTVPNSAVIAGRDNPTGSSIVWYSRDYDGAIRIWCFMPAGGA